MMEYIHSENTQCLLIDKTFFERVFSVDQIELSVFQSDVVFCVLRVSVSYANSVLHFITPEEPITALDFLDPARVSCERKS